MRRRRTLAGLIILMGASAVAFQNCQHSSSSPSSDVAAGGCGLVKVVNQSDEAAQITVSNQSASITGLTIASAKTVQQAEPAGTYTVSAVGVVSGASLLSPSTVTVDCNTP